MLPKGQSEQKLSATGLSKVGADLNMSTPWCSPRMLLCNAASVPLRVSKCMIIPKQPICSAFIPGSMITWSLNKLHLGRGRVSLIQSEYKPGSVVYQHSHTRSSGTDITYGHACSVWHKSKRHKVSGAAGDRGSSHHSCLGYTLSASSMGFTLGYVTICGLHCD